MVILKGNELVLIKTPFADKLAFEDDPIEDSEFLDTSFTGVMGVHGLLAEWDVQDAPRDSFFAGGENWCTNGSSDRRVPEFDDRARYRP